MSFRALAYLGWRAIVAHPLKRLRQRGTGLERFRAAYVSERLVPTTPEERAVSRSIQRCISCGLCETGCALVEASPGIRALGVHAAFRLYARNPADLPLAADALAACAGCAGCAEVCPVGIEVSLMVRKLRDRAVALRWSRDGTAPPRT